MQEEQWPIGHEPHTVPVNNRQIHDKGLPQIKSHGDAVVILGCSHDHDLV